MSNPTNPNNPQGSFQPPWLAKLNAASEQVEKAISHTPIEIETNPIQVQTEIETQPKDKVELNHTFGKLGPVSAMYDADIASKVTQTAQEVLQSMLYPHVVDPVEITYKDGLLEVPSDLPPGHYDAVIQSNSAGNNVVNPMGVRLEFNAAEFAQAIGRGSRGEADVESPVLDEEYKDRLLSKDKVQLNQEFGLLGQRDCEHVGHGFNKVLNYGGHGAHELDGPGEEDGPWAPGWAERCGSHGSPELDADAAKLEAMAGEGAAGPTFGDLQTPHFQSVSEAMLPDDQIPGMPTDWKPPVVVDLPEVVDVESKPLVQPASSVVDYVSADKDQPVVSEEEYYAAIVAQLRPSNPTEASLIERLRLFQSQYVGLITTPEQAIDHIAQCRRDNNPIGGSEAVELSAQSTSLKHKQYIERRYAPHKAKREAVEAARKGWKDAIAQKEAAMKQWDAFVKWHHDNYAQLKKTPVECFQSKQGGESNAQSD